MRSTIARIGIAGAGGMLALGLVVFAPPAGASGSGGHGVNHEDSTCFTAGGPQGHSHSDPDGMSNGGADKPGCPGGINADQDGNNGCGNDTDREDDNNGNCGRNKGHDTNGEAPAPAPAPTTTTTVTTAPPTTVTTEPSVAPLTEPTDCQVDPKEATGCPATTSAQTAGTTGARLAPAAESAGVTAATTPSDIGGAATDGASASTTTTTAPGTEVLGQTLTRPGTLARTGAGVGGLSFLGLALFGGGRLTALARRLLRIG